jgi:thiamine pyrophosphate-dependent acetolactate synthase large subunit-like protein
MGTIVASHEEGAGHMTEGCARATGKPGIVLVTSGSGTTNLVTVMQVALCDGTPMVVISGQGPAVLEVVTGQNSPGWPVVPAGKGLHEFVPYPDVTLSS